MADGEQAVTQLQERFPDGVVRTGFEHGQHWAEIQPDNLVEICTWLRDDEDLAFDYLIDVTAVHWPDDPQPMEVVYHLQSYRRDDRLRLRLRTGDTGPVPSVVAVWKAADWNERETYDMFGIRFEGHPDLRRILMPDDYTEFPLRKELPLFRG